MEKVLLMWHNRHISMAMMRWLAYAHEVVRSRQLLAKVVGRWTMHTLAKCWDEWTRKMPQLQKFECLQMFLEGGDLRLQRLDTR